MSPPFPPTSPPPQGSSAAAWLSFLDSSSTSRRPHSSSPKHSANSNQQHHNRDRTRKLSTASAPSLHPYIFPFLKLPIEVQVHVLAFLSPDDLHACLTLNRETYQLITDPWPWKAAFLRLFHNLPLIALGSSWRTEYSKRTYTWRKLVGNVVNTYTGTRLSNVSHVLPTQGNLLTLCDMSFGVAIRLQLNNGRQTQVGRYAIHGGNGTADVNEYTGFFSLT
ncbi:hypothetical protein BCR44DRAFT_1114140 [Catenaria anguillulae PL171]|uniref:F-box domain-containing protein n=1 Tax=Catenaria anguillulae PL171 TaxID=765915 RepID=A0A1Y2HQZ8_9FUNG|nr:hypothetical protein BCR44DRAFT_1114140 [Catenaria anguillulae PL171]